MKPWRPYWKHLDEIKGALLKDAGPTPFGVFSDSSSWIGKLPFTELTYCDEIIHGMIRNLKYGLGRIQDQSFGSEATLWQMILRVECGLSFVRGDLWKRKDFDWSQPQEAVYKWLLIELWYCDAMRWASHTFGSNALVKARLAQDIRSDLWQISKPKIFDAN